MKAARKRGVIREMDETKEKSKDLVQLARLALAGRPQDVQKYVQRMTRKYQATVPELADQLSKLLTDSPTRQSPLRSEHVAAIPVDLDSRLQLLRHEYITELDHAPIWAQDIRKKLEQIVAEHERTAELQKGGLAPTRTAIFTGPPGVGKTLAARWLAHKLKRPLLTLDLSAVISSFLGRTGANVRHVLDFAKGVPCVLLLDELDAIAKRRDDSHEVGELKRLVTVLLQEIDDWPEGGLLVAASNHAELLDPAVWRRFEAQINFTLPDQDAVAQAVRSFVGSEAVLGEEWLSTLSGLLLGSSFSDIERELKTVRRQVILEGSTLEKLFPEFIRRHIEGQTKAAKKEIALKLSEAGLSQRQINDLTGLSRDTLRKITPHGSEHAER
jgi:AAA+ superfamily predicted ATPase